MNRCRMTFRILFTLLAVLVLLVTSAAIAKEQSLDAPKTLKGLQPVNPELKRDNTVTTPGGGISVVDPVGIYDGEASKVAERRYDPIVVQPDNRASFLSEGFEVAVPPAGWSEIITNSAYNWKRQTLSFHTGTASADVEYDPALVPQDEWLVSPALNFTGATADLKVEFWWSMSYYWAVSPYDNYDLELWISTDGGATWASKLWDETGEGVFTNWTWYQKSISLAGYIGQTNVKLAWHYAGVDGAQALVDDISVNDNAAPIGRCCYGANQCGDMTQADCTTLGGMWDGTKNCTANPCPVAGEGDNCANALKITLPAALPYTDANQYTCGRLDDYNATCMGSYDGGEDIVYEVTVTAAVNVNITLNPKGTTYTGFAIDNAATCPLDAATGSCVAYASNSGSTAYSAINVPLAPGTYYLMVDTWPSPTCIPDFDLTIIETPPLPAGSNCGDPYIITLGLGDLPHTESGLLTCGMGNTYSNTCMGSYDGGEDQIIQLVLTDPMVLDITLNPNGTTWTGMAIDNVCPLDVATGSCLGIVTSSAGTAKTIYGLNLAAGTYYIMVDTYPSPNCIPSYSLSFAGAAPPPPNDLCANATPVGDIVSLNFNTMTANYDGAGTCQTSKNVWYLFTAPLTGNSTISLCGSSYDTKLAVYEGASCSPLGTLLACNDDACGVQSEAVVSVVAGNQYLVEVGGYSTNAGPGVISITTVVPPPNDNCEDVTPVVLTAGVPVTITGDNTGASPDCASFPGNNAWEAFTITECSNVTLDYCGTTPAFGNAWLNLAIGCPCTAFTPAGTWETSSCGDGNVSITWLGLPAGTYYYPVLTEAGAVGPYTMHIVAQGVTAYCAAAGFCDEYISHVVLHTLDNASGCSSSYSDYTALSTSLLKTLNYTITVTNGLPYTSDQCGVWVDWNDDYCFDGTERVTLTGGPTTWTGTVTPPMSAVDGPVRMRVRILYTGTVAPCGTTSYGEVEDYTINVLPLEPTAKIEPDPQYLYFLFAITPFIDDFVFGMFDAPYTANDVDLTSITVNGIPVTAAAVEASHPQFAGPVVRAELPALSFLPPYGILYDVNNETFTVAGLFTDATPFSITDDVVIIGKSSPTPGRYITPDLGFVLLPGDFDESGQITVSDAVGLINYIFAGGQAPANLLIGDTDCSQNVSISDAVRLISYIFGGGLAPCVAGQ